MVVLTRSIFVPDNRTTMLRVLMVLEDYGELMFLQTVLKKIGFDVEGVQNPRGFQDQLLKMNPDILVMTGFGKRVRGLDLAREVKKVRDLPHIILLHGASVVGGAGNFGVLKSSILSSNERQTRYAKFLHDTPAPEKHGFAVKQVQDQVKALRAEESSADLEDLERERKAFVEHLFKKKAE